jgi:glycolate oxidase iron-sulfur subunit
MPTTQELIQLTDQCVLCGLCLPHCPTYQVSQNEAESPRGRISLIKAYAQGHLEADQSLQAHLASCTNCLSCQTACPAKVPYERIIDGARSLQSQSKPIHKRILQVIAKRLITRNWGHQLIRMSRLLLGLLPSVSSIANTLPTSITRLSGVLRLIDVRVSQSESMSELKPIGVFPGCSGQLFDQVTLESVQGVLAHLGYRAVLPEKTLCCGALDQHSGEIIQAEQHLQQTLHHFQNHFDDDINDSSHTSSESAWLTFASGCSRQLDQYAAAHNIDIMSWLCNGNRLQQVHWKGTQQRVLVHIPCSINAIDQQSMLSLLEMVPNCEVEFFNDGLNCCGAGGMQLLSPERVNLDLLEKKCSRIHQLAPDVIVSPNIGCSLHLQTGLAQTEPSRTGQPQTELAVEVIHPVTFIYRQLNG